MSSEESVSKRHVINRVKHTDRLRTDRQIWQYEGHWSLCTI